MLNWRRERIVRGFKYILILYWFCSFNVVRGVNVVAGESITSFDVYRINLCDSLNALSRYLLVSSSSYSVMSFWANVWRHRHAVRLLSRAWVVNNLFERLHDRFKMTLSRNIFLDLASIQGAMFFTDRLSRFFNLPYNLLHARVYLCYQPCWRSSNVDISITTNRSAAPRTH